MVRLRFVEDEVGDDTIVFFGIAQHLFEGILAIPDKLGVAIIFVRININTHYQFKTGILYQFQLGFREWTPGSDGIVTGFFYYSQVEFHQIQIVGPDALIGMLPRAGADFVPKGFDKKLLAIEIIPIVLDLYSGLRPSRPKKGRCEGQDD